VAALARKGLEALETGLNLLSAVILFLLMFYVTAEVGMRYLLNRPLPGHLEASELLIVPAVFLALSYVQARRGHVGMDILRDRFREPVRRGVDCVTDSVALATFVIIAWFSWSNTLLSFRMGDVTPTAHFPTWWSKLSVPVGSALLCVRLAMQIAENLATLLARQRTPRWSP